MPENSTDAPLRQLNDDITAALKRHTARRTRHLFRVPGPENDSHLIAALRGVAESHAKTVAVELGGGYEEAIAGIKADHERALADQEAEHVKARNALRELLTDAGKEITRLKASLEGEQAHFAQRLADVQAEYAKRDQVRDAEIERLKRELDRYANPGEPPAGDPQPAPAEPAKPARNRARKPAAPKDAK